MDIRSLTPDDFEAVVALDQRTSGRARRAWFDQRLRAALRAPRRHVQLAAVVDGRLAGFVLGRLAGGEYGRPLSVGLLETIGVDPERQHAGIGHALLDGLAMRLRAKDQRELATEVDGGDRPMLAFCAANGFLPSGRLVLARDVEPVHPPEDDDGEVLIDKIPVRTLRADDVPALTRIDRHLTGKDRGAWLAEKVDEAMAESAVQVSLVAEDGGEPGGFVFARVDAGAFGVVAPTARLTTIDVDPRCARRHVGEALLYRLLMNLRALGVERVETEVDWDAFGLLAFLRHEGFRPSTRLALSRAIPLATP